MEWFTSDLHFGHTNIIRYSARPFDETGSMAAGIVERWNAAVDPDDVVWVLGDVTLNRTGEHLAPVAELNGHLILVPGNHDVCWPHSRNYHPGAVDEYLAAGFAEVVADPLPVVVGGEICVVNHFPHTEPPIEGRDGERRNDRYAEHRPPADPARWLLHGHVHDMWRQWGRQINVGIDAWGGRPVSVDTLAELIAAGPADLERIPWWAPVAA